MYEVAVLFHNQSAALTEHAQALHTLHPKWFRRFVTLYSKLFDNENARGPNATVRVFEDSGLPGEINARQVYAVMTQFRKVLEI